VKRLHSWLSNHYHPPVDTVPVGRVRSAPARRTAGDNLRRSIASLPIPSCSLRPSTWYPLRWHLLRLHNSLHNCLTARLLARTLWIGPSTHSSSRTTRQIVPSTQRRSCSPRSFGRKLALSLRCV
jgi:hypothetical protein